MVGVRRVRGVERMFGSGTKMIGVIHEPMSVITMGLAPGSLCTVGGDCSAVVRCLVSGIPGDVISVDS